MFPARTDAGDHAEAGATAGEVPHGPSRVVEGHDPARPARAVRRVYGGPRGGCAHGGRGAVQEVQRRNPGTGEGDPERAVGTLAPEVVRHPGQCGEEVGVAGARTGEVVTGEAAGAGLGDHQEGSVGAGRQAIGELQPVQQDFGLATGGRKAQQPSCAGVFDDVADPLLQWIAPAGDGEVHAAVRQGDDVAAEAEPLPRHRVREHADGAFGARDGIDAQQAALRVAHQQAAVRQRFEAQRTATGLGQHLHTGRARVAEVVDTQDPAVRHAGQHAPVRVHHHVLGTAGAEGDVVQRNECRGSVHARALRGRPARPAAGCTVAGLAPVARCDRRPSSRSAGRRPVTGPPLPLCRPLTSPSRKRGPPRRCGSRRAGSRCPSSCGGCAAGRAG